MKLNCLDLQQQHQKIKAEIFAEFEKVYDSTAFSGGPFAEKFEKEFAEFIGSKYAVSVSNGTVALHLAMLALEIGLGDEVIVPANTFIATAWGVSHAGATPVFVDCDKNTWEIDAEAIEAAITKKTKAIIGVHLYGQPFDIDAVREIANRHNLYLIEDAAQAQGARYKGVPIGSFGIMACFSFYPGKNLGACGEAGGITTNNPDIYEKLRSLRNHGSVKRYFHDEIGYNYRIGGLEAASLSVKLKYLAEWNDRRRFIADFYQKNISNKKVKLQYKPDFADGVYHLFVLLVQDREAFVAYLAENGINAAFHYPVPCHLQKAYEHLGYKPGILPNSENLASGCVSIPMYPELTDDQMRFVVEVVNNF